MVEPMPTAKWLPTAKYLHECFSYTPATGTLTWKARPRYHFKSASEQRRWNAVHAGKQAGRGTRYIHTKITHQPVGQTAELLVHRVILKMHTGRWPKWTDHINGIKTDNRLANLRTATPQQNGWWRRPSGRDLPRGVMPSKNGMRYTAFIRINGLKKNLGTFDTPKEARAAWCAIARKQRGAFFRAE